VKKNVGKSVIGNWKLKPVIGNFTGNRLTDNRLTTLNTVDNIYQQFNSLILTGSVFLIDSMHTRQTFALVCSELMM